MDGQGFSKPVLVVGASGETGRRVVKALQARQIPVRVVVRSTDKAELVEGPNTEVVIADPLSESDLRQALAGTQAVISAMGTRSVNDLDEIERVEHLFVATLARLAKEAGLEQVVLCSSLGTTNPDRFAYIANVLRAKRKGEEALEQSGISYSIIRPGGLTNDPGGQEGVGVFEQIERPGRITRDDVAEVLVQALLQPQARNGTFEIINWPGAGPATRPKLFVF